MLVTTSAPNDRLHGYYAFQRDRRGEPNLQGNTVPGFGDTRQSRRQIFTLNETHIFGPNLTNEARLGFNRINITFTPNFAGESGRFRNQQRNQSGHRLASDKYHRFQLQHRWTQRVSARTRRYDARSFRYFELSARESLVQVWRRGEAFLQQQLHARYRRLRFSQRQQFPGGNGNAFQVTLGDRSSAIIQNAFGFYVQDNFKVRPNLTLELGLRYDWNMTPTERYNRFVVFDPADANAGSYRFRD